MDLSHTKACPSVEPVTITEFINFNPLLIVSWRIHQRHRNCRHTSARPLEPEGTSRLELMREGMKRVTRSGLRPSSMLDYGIRHATATRGECGLRVVATARRDSASRLEAHQTRLSSSMRRQRRLSERSALRSETHEPQAVSHRQLPQVHASTGEFSHRRKVECYSKNGGADIRCIVDPSMISQYRSTTGQEWWVVFLFQAISPMRLSLNDAISRCRCARFSYIGTILQGKAEPPKLLQEDLSFPRTNSSATSTIFRSQNCFES